MPKRRANGEGNIRKRKDGRWEGRYTAGYDLESGKRIIKNVLGKTQAEVKEKFKAAISESQRLDVSKAGTYTVSSWVKTWYEVYAEPRIRPNTKAYYTNYIENHIIPRIGSVPLNKLTTIQIQRFYNNLQKTGRVQRKNFPELRDKSLSPRVVRGVHTLLHNCLEQAVAERLILANPAQGCKLPQLEKREMKILPQEKIGMYLAEAERRGLLAAFYLELTTGLRRGELLALQWTDLDVENRTLSITKQVNRINGELVVSPPKTRNSIRTLALPQQAVDLLVSEHKKHPTNPYLFPSPKTGTMYDPDAFRRTHDKILKAIGAEHIRFHDLRHTFATLSLKSGVDVKTLSGALGHYSAGFTLNTYTHATAQMKQDAADTIVRQTDVQSALGNVDGPVGTGVALVLGLVAQSAQQHLHESIAGQGVGGLEGTVSITGDDTGLLAVSNVASEGVVGRNVLVRSGVSNQSGCGGGAKDQVADDLGSSATGQGGGGIEGTIGVTIDDLHGGHHVNSFFVSDLAAVGEVLGTSRDGDQRHGHHQSQYQRKELLHGVSSLIKMSKHSLGSPRPRFRVSCRG